MRYAVIIPDGAADQPHPALGNRTPLAAATIPHMDRLAREGRLGLARTIPAGMPPGSDVANLSVLGYDPAICYTGRAPLEAASLGITLKAGEAAFRANTVTVIDGIMKDYSAGHILTPESRPLIEQLQRDLDLGDARLYPGTAYRHLIVFADMAAMIPTRTPPHDILDQPVAGHDPVGAEAPRLLAVENESARLLPRYEANRKRIAAGKSPVTQLWLWGGGVMPKLEPFATKHGVEGGLISAVDLLKGIAKLAGLEVIEVPGATGYYDTDYAGKGAAALDCLGRKRFVVVHVEAPDEAGHNGHPEEKVKALEEIDKHIVGKLLAAAESAGDLRILLLPDHPTPLAARTHTSDPVPYVLWGPGITPGGGDSFSEAAAESGGDDVVPAPGLMGILTA